jgi:hypothetical protein
MTQYARGVVHHDAQAGEVALTALERIKWLLWHGNQHRAKGVIGDLLDDADALEVDYPGLRAFRRAIQEFQSYIEGNATSLINYGERYRAGERISSCLAESTVNAVISKRFAKRQRCNGRSAVPTCCRRPAPGRWTERFVRHSNDGTREWPPTTPRTEQNSWRRRHPTNSHALRIEDAKHGLMKSFASGIVQGQAAVKAALTQPWSNGQTEGQNTKLKLVKRQMYSRAGYELLRARLLGAV